MSAERDRMRRILGIELAEAARRAGVTGPIERRLQPDTLAGEQDSADLLYFASYDHYLAWLDSQERMR
ncbi:hypothetical protein [Noviherbaspirillum malthae]|uniref:hypothetical protein n=1 Tax=Noviherbaspirillum malthae TaxID=1260987 RepID=UPI00188F0841|nr:hypothetical protein [Noviherbaspirillum malthae]